MLLDKSSLRKSLLARALVKQVLLRLRTAAASASAAPATAIPTYVDKGTAVNSAGDLTVAWPAGHQANDVAILVVEHANQAPTLGTDSGFVAVTGGSQGTGLAGAAAGTGITLFWCRASGSSQADVVVADPGNHMTGQIFVFRGCKTTGDPFEAVAGDTLAFASTSTTVTIPGGTTTVANTLVFLCASTSTDQDSTTEFSGWTNAALSDLTERGDYSSLQAGGGGFGVATGGKAAAGAVGNTTALLGTTSAQARISFALIPAGA